MSFDAREMGGGVTARETSIALVADVITSRSTHSACSIRRVDHLAKPVSINVHRPRN
jgi:hypothetical protein